MSKLYEITLNDLTELDVEYKIPKKGVIIAQLEEGDDMILPNGRKAISPYIRFENSEYKTYAIYRMYKHEILTGSFCYGKEIDFEELKRDPEKRKKFLKQIVSIKGLNDAQDRFGYLVPIDTEFDANDNIIAEEGSDFYRSLKTNLKCVMEGVVEKAHKEKVAGRETIEIEKEEFVDIDEEEKLGMLETIGKIRQRDSSTVRRAEFQKEKLLGKDGKIWRILKEHQKEIDDQDKKLQVKKNEEKGIETDAKEKIGKRGVYCIFYRSGLAMTKKGEVIPRYNVFFWDAGIKKKTPITSFFISDVVEKKLGKNGVHRKKFVNNICAAILDAREDMYFLDWDLAYLGRFSEDSKVGLKPDDQMQDLFQKLGGYTNPGEDEENSGGGDERV